MRGGRWGLASDKESYCDFSPQLHGAWPLPESRKSILGGSTLLPSLLLFYENVSVGNYPLSRLLLHYFTSNNF